MADQQDQLSSGGSVETASASADTSKVRGKSSSSGSSGYRKRQSTGSIPVTVEEKRRRQTIGDPQSSEVFNNTSCKHSSDSTGIRTKSEFKSHGSGLESYLDNNWKPQHKVQQSTYNISANSTRARSVARTSLPELNLTAIDCVASRTRSRTPQNPQAISQGHNSYNLSLSSGYDSKEDLTYNNLVPTSTTTPVTSHPSTSRGRGLRMSECLEGFVSAVKALFPISTQTYHQEGSKSHGGATCASSSASSQVLSVKSSIRVGNAASNSVESGGGALAHDGAGTSGITTATASPPVSAAAAANPAHSHPTHKHILRSRTKLSSDYKELSSINKTSGKHHKKDTTTGTCSSSRKLHEKNYINALTIL